jgi:N5-(cytidine 5'-diphosphoramidyl)-L-glutamine hydrolase
MLKIGISQRIVNAKNYDEKRDALSHEWTSFLEKLKIIPILIPNSLADVHTFLQQFHFDGIILSGGDDIGKNLERDSTEKTIIEYSLKNNIPVLGICRGMQLLNSYFGGNISKNLDSSHVNKPHSLNINTNSFLKFLPKSIDVNSFHNNIINQENLAKELLMFAIDPRDNSIEGIYHETLPIIGIMWHPERSQNQINISLLTNFFIKDTLFSKLN